MTYSITNGTVQIDDVHLQLVSGYRWHKNDQGYAVWRGIEDGVKKTIRMHRLVTGAKPGEIVDHINGDRLDNRSINLRIVTQSDNLRNQAKHRDGTYKGYWFQKQNNKWVVEIHGRHRGTFPTEAEAKEFARQVYAGLVDKKPKLERTHCKHGHSLDDAYVVNGKKVCKPCQKQRSVKYFKKAYVAKPRVIATVCSRGHDRSTYRTENGDCRLCAIIRSRKARNNGTN